jgi:glycosyltransferase involved in cell wall biosynthesis
MVQKTPGAYSSSNPSVSIVCVSRGNRVRFLDITKSCIAKQTYKNIIELIFVDGSQTPDESELFQNYFSTVLKKEFPIARCGSWIGAKNIGAYRNESNRLASGEIIVNFDDDDYYFPQRVKHTVEMLVKHDGSIAGCDDHYIYDSDMDMLCRAPKTGLSNLVTNNTMAYSGDFARKNKYDETKSHAEEPSFIGNEYVISLIPTNITVQFSHSNNTYNKQKLMIEAILKAEGVSPIASTERCSMRVDEILCDSEFLNSMRAFLKPKDATTPQYDIEYYAGFFQPEWDPAAKDLGGSEQAIVHLSKCWKASGLRVAVYANIKEEKVCDGVNYFQPHRFSFQRAHNIVICWRASGCFIIPIKFKFKKLYVDFHDNFDNSLKFLRNYSHKIDGYFFKSKFHATCYDRIIEHVEDDKKHIIMNGLRIEEFTQKVPVERDNLRFVYASSYDRGLLWMVKGLWPVIQKLEPRAELHVYYGFDSMQKETKENQGILLEAFATGNIMDHGRQPVDIIAREKFRAGFQLYPCMSAAEIDCISVRESLVAGCIPILPKFGVFLERDGFFINFDIRDPNTLIKPAIEIVKLARDSASCEALRKELAKSKTIKSWQEISEEWKKIFD